MAFSINGSNPYSRYTMPTVGQPAAYGANTALGQMMPPAAAPAFSAAPTQAFTHTASSQMFGATGYPLGTPNSSGFAPPNRLPGAAGYNPFGLNRPFNAPYSPTGYPYQTPVIYANPAALSQQEKQKKYWSKFMLNTGSTLAGLSLAAYFGMKILPKAIVNEMGVQVKNNLLSKNTRKAMLASKARELLVAPDTPKWIKDLIQKDLSSKNGNTLSKWQKAKLEKILLEKSETSEVASAFLKDSLTQTMADPKFQQSTANFMHTTFDDKFQTEFSGKMIDSIQKAAEEKNVIGWLHKKIQQTLKDNGSWLSRFV